MHLNDEAKFIFAKEGVVDSAIILFSLISWEHRTKKRLDSLEMLITTGGLARQTFVMKLEDVLTKLSHHEEFKKTFEWRKKNNLTNIPLSPDESTITGEFKRFKKALTNLLIVLNQKHFRMAFSSVSSEDDDEQLFKEFRIGVTDEELAEINDLSAFLEYIDHVKSEVFWKKVFNAIGK